MKSSSHHGGSTASTGEARPHWLFDLVLSNDKERENEPIFYRHGRSYLSPTACLAVAMGQARLRVGSLLGTRVKRTSLPDASP